MPSWSARLLPASPAFDSNSSAPTPQTLNHPQVGGNRAALLMSLPYNPTVSQVCSHRPIQALHRARVHCEAHLDMVALSATRFLPSSTAGKRWKVEDWLRQTQLRLSLTMADLVILDMEHPDEALPKAVTWCPRNQPTKTW